ncbi:hypothetical protein RUM8411_04026 [Ruegeria meonggei]|uniref:Uncharacterized protein n=1 Tax=Ruegeria meonggei TaxID=1446476 RepID=A0A1X7AAQ4_9RHOB|nr:hypothetical protein RUM8411_04026 [Ruegeria meonggei]
MSSRLSYQQDNEFSIINASTRIETIEPFY